MNPAAASRMIEGRDVVELRRDSRRTSLNNVTAPRSANNAGGPMTELRPFPFIGPLLVPALLVRRQVRRCFLLPPITPAAVLATADAQLAFLKLIDAGTIKPGEGTAPILTGTGSGNPPSGGPIWSAWGVRCGRRVDRSHAT